MEFYCWEIYFELWMWKASAAEVRLGVIDQFSSATIKVHRQTVLSMQLGIEPNKFHNSNLLIFASSKFIFLRWLVHSFVCNYTTLVFFGWILLKRAKTYPAKSKLAKIQNSKYVWTRFENIQKSFQLKNTNVGGDIHKRVNQLPRMIPKASKFVLTNLFVFLFRVVKMLGSFCTHYRKMKKLSKLLFKELSWTWCILKRCLIYKFSIHKNLY